MTTTNITNFRKNAFNYVEHPVTNVAVFWF